MKLYEKEKIAAFYLSDTMCSNFYKCNIQYENITFNSSEQLFMYLKAICFEDYETALKIAKEISPMKAKSLGKKVKNYDDGKWNEVRYTHMLYAVGLKIKQNEHISNILIPLRKEGYSFVEASPTDLIWGVGLEENDKSITDKYNWKGTNLLGKAIDEALDEIIQSQVNDR